MASKSLIDWIIENGGEILVDLFAGGIKACVNDPNLVNCILGAVDIASLGLVAVKAFEVGRALWRILSGLGKFAEDLARARGVLTRGQEIIGAARVGNCFPAGTMVETEDGQKPIEQVQTGDRVWSKDPFTGQSALHTVAGTFQRHVDALTIVGVGDTTVRTTAEHPFWVVDKGWTPAADLLVGDRLDSRNGTDAAVTSLATQDISTTVYNFEVDTDHDYEVSPRGLLVHNTCALLPNLMPDTLASELATAADLGVSPVRVGPTAEFQAVLDRLDTAGLAGHVKWAVLEDGTLVVVPHEVSQIEISHAVLSGGQPVVAAGEANIAGSLETGYFGLDINSRSGHFVGGNTAIWDTVEKIDRDAFGKVGIHF